jgi:DNA-binding response OmpR family regulator
VLDLPHILVSNNSELLRHLSAVPFRGLGLNITVAARGDEALTLSRDIPVDLAILDAELPAISGYEVAKKLTQENKTCRVVLVMGKRISGEQMRRLAESGCDEVLIAPMSADELYDVVAIQLGLPRHGDQPYLIDVTQKTPDGWQVLDAMVSNLSVDGVRLICHETVAEGATLRIAVRFEEPEQAPLELCARAVWVQEGEDDTVVGASFEGVTADQRTRLSQLTKWEIVDDTERARIVIKGDLTEAVNLNDLLPEVIGRISFDLSQVRYMNSLGVREWVRFLGRASAQGYEFHACSPAFVLQASMVKGVLGRGTVISFFAPYVCTGCDLQAEKLLQSATVLAANYVPPTFSCPRCNHLMELDDLPDRYFAFLRPAAAEA